jgi:hypothetical protein
MPSWTLIISWSSTRRYLIMSIFVCNIHYVHICPDQSQMLILILILILIQCSEGFPGLWQWPRPERRRLRSAESAAIARDPRRAEGALRLSHRAAYIYGRDAQTVSPRRESSYSGWNCIFYVDKYAAAIAKHNLNTIHLKATDSYCGFLVIKSEI